MTPFRGTSPSDMKYTDHRWGVNCLSLLALLTITACRLAGLANRCAHAAYLSTRNAVKNEEPQSPQGRTKSIVVGAHAENDP